MKKQTPWVKCIYVEWRDPTSIDIWTYFDKIKEDDPHVVVSIGQIVKETRTHYALSLNIDWEESAGSCSMLIPKKLVKYSRIYWVRKRNGKIEVSKTRR